MRRQEIGTRWRRLSAARQALLALAHLRCGDTYAQLAAGFATVYRYIREAVRVLSAFAPTVPVATRTIQAKAFVILDGALLPSAWRTRATRSTKGHGMPGVKALAPFLLSPHTTMVSTSHAPENTGSPQPEK